jgi:O-antigen/teichoic acid export membrane protein
VALSAPLAMALYVIAAGLAFGAGIWLLWRATPAEVSRSSPRFDNRAWLLSALPLAFIGGMQLINQQASILLQGFYLPDADIGIFRVATQVSNLASFGLLAINIVVAPRFAALNAQDNKPKLQRLVTRSAQVILVFNLAITAGFVLLGKPFLRILFGPSYVAAYLPLLILLGGQLVNSGVGSVGVLLNMTHHERETAKALALSALLNVALNLLLLPRLGILGSSIATALTLIIWNIMLWWAVRKRLGINSLAFRLTR